MYEVFLGQKVTNGPEWGRFFEKLMRTCLPGEKVELTIRFERPVVRFFLKTRRKLPFFLVGAEQFTLHECSELPEEIAASPGFGLLSIRKNDTLLEVAERLEMRHETLKEANFVVRKIAFGNFYFAAYLTVERGGGRKLFKVPYATVSLLDLDFRKNFTLNRAPKYLDLSRSLQLLDTDRVGAILKVNTYPFLNHDHYLSLKNFDFYKHSVMFGASGTGKTKFLSYFITQIVRNYSDKYHVVMIDPHDTVRDDLGGLPNTKVFDFTTGETGTKLFASNAQDVMSGVEATTDLIKALIGSDWNARLERLTRSCLYLLTVVDDLNFQSLRRVLSDVAYRNACLANAKNRLPISLQEFFGQDFNEMRTQHYDSTFAVMLSFIDELQLVPAFYRPTTNQLDFELTKNSLTLISLNQSRLGAKGVKTIAGLVMNQVFLFGLQRKFSQHIILVIDEIAVVENPILLRFLSEARKYNISVCIAGQYFSQISPELKMAISANVANYFCFRLNRTDAEEMVDYLGLELSSNKQLDYADKKRSTFITDRSENFGFERVKFLTTLSNRDVVAKVSKNDLRSSAIMGRSLDFVPCPEPLENARVRRAADRLDVPSEIKKIRGLRAPTANVFELMREQSTSRRKVN